MDAIISHGNLLPLNFWKFLGGVCKHGQLWLQVCSLSSPSCSVVDSISCVYSVYSRARCGSQALWLQSTEFVWWKALCSGLKSSDDTAFVNWASALALIFPFVRWDNIVSMDSALSKVNGWFKQILSIQDDVTNTQHIVCYRFSKSFILALTCIVRTLEAGVCWGEFITLQKHKPLTIRYPCLLKPHLLRHLFTKLQK